jgi:hypothetical protein
VEYLRTAKDWLAPTNQLSASERLALHYAALMPSECVVWEWAEALTGDEFPEIDKAAGQGGVDRWPIIRSRLEALRLVTTAQGGEWGRMHRLLQEVIASDSGFEWDKLLIAVLTPLPQARQAELAVMPSRDGKPAARPGRRPRRGR